MSNLSFNIGQFVVYRNFYINRLLKIDMIIDDKTVGYRGAKRDFMKFEGCADIEDLRVAGNDEIKSGYRRLEIDESI